MKTITYRGEKYEVEDWVNFVATDDDVTIWCYEHKPYKEDGCWVVHGGNFCQIYQPETDWDNSLEEV